MTAPSWASLDAALARWRDAGRTPRLWWRDDDAVEPTAALERLLGLAGGHSAPLSLAVIPEGATSALAERLAGEAGVAVLAHGWSHRNHAPSSQKKQELGPHRPAAEVLAELGAGLRRIETLFGARALPVLVPPWNRIGSEIVPGLAGLGYRVLSVFGPPRPAGLPVLNATVDIMDWHGTRGCRPAAEIVAELVGQLDAGLSSGTPQPIGLLTHHLVHDEAAWAFLDRLLETTGRQDPAWSSADALLRDGCVPAN
ncbi:MAG: polysaccharide deacetylase family protein [Rhizobiaceae bacterium]|nr:polysaccharide deacetylase family protein [Rhizobiaceae bacterium]